MPDTESGPLTQRVRWDIDYDIHLGATWSRFMRGLQACRILGNRCPACERVFVPPQAFCEACFERTDAWLDIPPTGDLQTYTVVELGFRGGPEPPYAVGAIRLDGADTLLMHFIGGVDLADPEGLRAQLPGGGRVQAVWAGQRSGQILDIRHFAPAAGAGDE